MGHNFNKKFVPYELSLELDKEISFIVSKLTDIYRNYKHKRCVVNIYNEIIDFCSNYSENMEFLIKKFRIYERRFISMSSNGFNSGDWLIYDYLSKINENVNILQ